MFDLLLAVCSGVIYDVKLEVKLVTSFSHSQT